jgi:hypothetical protein
MRSNFFVDFLQCVAKMNEELITAMQQLPTPDANHATAAIAVARNEMIREAYSKMGKLEAHIEFALQLLKPIQHEQAS